MSSKYSDDKELFKLILNSHTEVWTTEIPVTSDDQTYTLSAECLLNTLQVFADGANKFVTIDFDTLTLTQFKFFASMAGKQIVAKYIKADQQFKT